MMEEMMTKREPVKDTEAEDLRALVENIKQPFTLKIAKERIGTNLTIEEVNGKIRVWQSDHRCMCVPNYEYIRSNDEPISFSDPLEDGSGLVQSIVGISALAGMKVSYYCLRHEVIDGVQYYYEVDPFDYEPYTHIHVMVEENQGSGVASLDVEKLKELKHCKVIVVGNCFDDGAGKTFLIEDNSTSTRIAVQRYKDSVKNRIVESARSAR